MTEKTILVVEDNPDHLELTLLTLQENGIRNQIVVAPDGVEALSYLFGHGKYEGRDCTIQPEVVLLDLKLPKLSGIEVLQRIRADPLTEFVPVVILTSSSEEEDVIASYRSGANAFVRKPVDFGDFTQKLRQLQVFWVLVNESRAAAS